MTFPMIIRRKVLSAAKYFYEVSRLLEFYNLISSITITAREAVKLRVMYEAMIKTFLCVNQTAI